MVAYPQAMPSRVKSPAKTKKLPQLSRSVQGPDPVQLDNIKAQLDLVLSSWTELIAQNRQNLLYSLFAI